MSNDDIRRVEVITGVARRRYWPAHEKLRIIEESLVPGESVSAVARRNGGRRTSFGGAEMDEGGTMAVGSNERWSAPPRSASSRTASAHLERRSAADDGKRHPPRGAGEGAGKNTT